MVKGKVLIIDDVKQVRDLVVEAMLENEYEYEVCDGIVPAMNMVKDRDFDIVIVDKNMPSFDGEGRGGLELLRYVKEIKPNIAVVMMTGFVSAESMTDAMKLGVNDFIFKPFSIGELIEKIDRIRSLQILFDPDKISNFYKAVYSSLIYFPGESDTQKYDYNQQHLKIMRDELDSLFQYINSLKK